MTEQEFDNEVKAVIEEFKITESLAESIVIKNFLPSDSGFKIDHHIGRLENSEHHKFTERLKKTADSQLTTADLELAEKLINKDFRVEVNSLKLFIFDYYNNLKPGMVFAYNQEEAITMIKEAGITGQPDKFYSSVKEIEIPVDPIYIRYAAGE